MQVTPLLRRSARRDSALTEDGVAQLVRHRYGAFAERGRSKEACCAAAASDAGSSFAVEHGLYTQEELSLLPDIARDLSRGCGNPTAFASIGPGETVVDFGCGGGIDIVLAAHRVGPKGKVTGIDFTPQMVKRAEQAVAEAGLADRVELRVEDIAGTELPDDSTDVLLSNCVINLVPDKDAVYREGFRILRPGGRLAISDIVLTEEIAPELQERFRSTWAGCLGGAIPEDPYLETVRRAGFRDIRIVARHQLPSEELEAMACCPGEDFCPAPSRTDLAAVEGKVASLKFTATA